MNPPTIPDYSPAPRRSKLAAASLAVALLAYVPLITCLPGNLESGVFLPVFGAPVGLAAIILGTVARRHTTRQRVPGRGMALAGILLGAAAFLLYGLAFLIVWGLASI